jgi:hypothetical protein
MNNRKSPSTALLKTKAKALRAYLAEQGIDLGHGKCLEAIARQHGFKNWDAASGTLKAEPVHSGPVPQNGEDFPVWDPSSFSLPPTDLSMNEGRTLLIVRLVDVGNSTQCPCCTRHVKMWKRKLYNSMVRWLMWIVQESDAEIARGNTEGWVNYEKGPRFQDYSKLQYWGLIEPRPHTPEEKGTAGVGVWRPTKLARDFVAEKVELPTHAYVYNNVVYGFTEERITIRVALGKKFDYAEMLRGDVPNFGFGKSKGKAAPAPEPTSASEFDVVGLLNSLHDETDDS